MWPFRRNSAFDVRSAQPWWLMRNGTGDAGPRLRRDLDCDVAIIGAGISGALIADALVATGRRIVMLDQHEPGMGSTAASTALLQYEIDTDLADLTRMLGAERAAQAYLACAASFAMLEQRYPELLPPADYQRARSLYIASDDSAIPALRVELAARRAVGIQVEWLEGDELRSRYGLQRPGGISSALGASMDPVRFTRGLLAGCLRHGMELYTHAEVEAIEEGADALTLRIAGGQSVHARHVVVASGYESLKFLPLEVAEVDNTFALVTEPLEDPRRARLPLVWESARPYLYIRSTRDGRLVVGGADLPFKNAAAREALLPRQVARISSGFERLFGEPLPPIAYAWAGSFAHTADGLPYIGRAPGVDPRLQFALCFGGNGITYAAHAGDMIRAGIENRNHALEPVFGFERLRRAGKDLARGTPVRAGGVAEN